MEQLERNQEELERNEEQLDRERREKEREREEKERGQQELVRQTQLCFIKMLKFYLSLYFYSYLKGESLLRPRVPTKHSN